MSEKYHLIFEISIFQKSFLIWKLNLISKLLPLFALVIQLKITQTKHVNHAIILHM